MYDIIIIGTGPAGLAAAIYGERARLSLLVIEKQPMSGGQIINTTDVDDYPGLQGWEALSWRLSSVPMQMQWEPKSLPRR